MNTKKLRNKIVWITGASSGIGEALALRMAEAGARPILSARREERLRQVADRCEKTGAEVRVLPLDLADLASLPSRAEAARALFGRIDVLVNNGGMSQRATALETDFRVDRLFMDVNYFSAVALTKAILPSMIGHGSGHIVVTSSILGKYSVQTRSAYAASKHALHGFFDSLRCEMAVEGHPIGITLICPGWVRTGISTEALKGDGTRYGITGIEQHKGISPERCADTIIKAIVRGRDEVVVGGPETRLVLIKRLFPGLLNRVLPKFRVM